MDTPLLRAALLRAAPRLCMIAGLAFFTGCASYSRKPLLEDEFQQVLERRSPVENTIVQGVSVDAYGPDDGLTLEEAELLALYLNPRLRSARRDAQVLSASARYANLWQDPEIGADALRILEDVEESWIAGASLSFTIPISGRLSVAKDQSKAEARAAIVEAWTEEQQVLLELRQTWAEWEAATETLSVNRSLYGDLQRLVELTNRREELGELIAAEAVAFRLAEARLRLAIEQIEAEKAQARLRVIDLLGLLPGADVALVPDEAHAPASADGPDVVYQRSPQVLLAAARYHAAEERLRLEVRKQYPDINLGPLYGYEEGMSRLGLGFSIPIPILNANRQGIAEADAAREAARAEWEQAVQEALSAKAQAEAALAAAQQRVATLEETIVPLAAQQIDQARQLAELGELNTLLILEALQAEREAELDLIDAQADVQTAAVQLRFVVPDEAPAFVPEADEAAP
ncbi:MAG: TolC family protein [Sumerlaeia bacterium]